MKCVVDPWGLGSILWPGREQTWRPTKPHPARAEKEAESIMRVMVTFDPWMENLDQCSVENIRVRLSVAIKRSCKPNQENNILGLINEEGNRTIAALWDPATNYEEEDIKALFWSPLAQPYESLDQIHPWFNTADVSGVNSRKKSSLSLL